MSEATGSWPSEALNCDVNELRTLFLFEKLTDDQLRWLCERGRVALIDPGPVFAEGTPATCFYVLLEGTIAMSRRVGTDDIEVNRTSQRGVYAGAFTAYMGDRVSQVYMNSVKAVEPSRFFVLDADTFAELMNEWFPMAVHLLEGVFFGTKNTQQAIGQRERLLALGSLSAGLTHELNNPAAAAVRATAALRERVAGMRHKLGMIASGKWDKATLVTLIRLQEEAAERAPKAVALSPLETSDREDAIADWLEERGCHDGWQLAPTFVAFHPWITLEGYADLLAAIAGLDLVEHVSPVQLTIRLLVPSGSRLLELPEARAAIGQFDEDALCYRWVHPDPRVDRLQRELESTVAHAVTAKEDRRTIFRRAWEMTHKALAMRAGRLPDVPPGRPRVTIPYMTEPWYC